MCGADVGLNPQVFWSPRAGPATHTVKVAERPTGPRCPCRPLGTFLRVKNPFQFYGSSCSAPRASLPDVLVALRASDVNLERLLSNLGSDPCPHPMPQRDSNQEGGGRPRGKANARQRLRRISSLLLRSESGLGFAPPSPVSVA